MPKLRIRQADRPRWQGALEQRHRAEDRLKDEEIGEHEQLLTELLDEPFEDDNKLLSLSPHSPDELGEEAS